MRLQILSELRVLRKGRGRRNGEGNPLTSGELEFTRRRVGSPRGTLFRNGIGELGFETTLGVTNRVELLPSRQPVGFSFQRPDSDSQNTGIPRRQERGVSQCSLGWKPRKPWTMSEGAIQCGLLTPVSMHVMFSPGKKKCSAPATPFVWAATLDNLRSQGPRRDRTRGQSTQSELRNANSCRCKA